MSSAKLLALVDDNNSSTTVTFHYGISSGNYTESISASNSPLAAYSCEAELYANVSNLLPRKTYYFLIVAKNTYGSTRSSESTFKTPAPFSPHQLPQSFHVFVLAFWQNQRKQKQ